MSKSTQEQVVSCSICDSEAIDESIEELIGVCIECGFVIHDPEDTTPEWLQSPEELEEQPDEDWLAVCRVRDSTEQQLAQAFAALEDIGEVLCLDTDIREEAAAVYCDAYIAGTTDGRDTTCTIASSVRLASLAASKPIPSARLNGLPAVDKKKYRLSHTALQTDLGLRPILPTPEDYCHFYAEELDLEPRVLNESHRIFEQISGQPALTGKDPVGITGSVIYLTAENITQSELADAGGISTETIRQRVNQLRNIVSDD